MGPKVIRDLKEKGDNGPIDYIHKEIGQGSNSYFILFIFFHHDGLIKI